jgi:hypothetical protein
MTGPSYDTPDCVYWAASLARKILENYRAIGGTDADLFAAFAAIVSARDQQVCADCLKALEEAISKPSSGACVTSEIAWPSAL